MNRASVYTKSFRQWATVDGEAALATVATPPSSNEPTYDDDHLREGHPEVDDLLPTLGTHTSFLRALCHEFVRSTISLEGKFPEPCHHSGFDPLVATTAQVVAEHPSSGYNATTKTAVLRRKTEGLRPPGHRLNWTLTAT